MEAVANAEEQEVADAALTAEHQPCICIRKHAELCTRLNIVSTIDGHSDVVKL
jgi:hypothetical protein